MRILDEIHAQPEAWRRTIEHFIDHPIEIELRGVENLLFTGCGSAYYLGQTAAERARDVLGVGVRAVPASEIIFFPSRTIPVGGLLVAVSRSGRTSETLEAMRTFKKQGLGQVVGITTASESPFSEYCDTALILPPVAETGIIQIGSITSMTLTALAMLDPDFASISGLPDAAAQIIQTHEAAIAALAQETGWERIFFLGMGHHYGVANEAALKMKESALVDCDAYHSLEFRHGPSILADDRALVVGIVGKKTAAHEARVLADMAAQGARVLALTHIPLNLPASDRLTEIVLQADLPTWCKTLLYHPLLQLLAVYRAQHKGLNPDNPPRLNAYVDLGDALS